MLLLILKHNCTGVRPVRFVYGQRIRNEVLCSFIMLSIFYKCCERFIVSYRQEWMRGSRTWL